MKNPCKIALFLLTTLVLSGCTKGKTPSNSEQGKQLSGSITIAIPMSSEEISVLTAVADEYRHINPRVTINIDGSGLSGTYNDWLNSILANNDMTTVTADVVRNNMASQYFGSNKFVDISQYLSKKNPYANDNAWRDGFETIALTPNGSHGELYSLNFKSTQVSLFYNKSIFQEANIDVNGIVTWSDFKNALQQIENTYPSGDVIPLAIDGSASSFWSGQMSWLFRVYTDQYFRSVANDVHTQPGDWNYDEFFDGDWSYKPHPSDYDASLSEEERNNLAWFNDNAERYTKNELRLLQGIMKSNYGPNTEKFKNMLANFRDVFPRYCGEAFSSDKSSFFWNGKAAITLDETSLLVLWKNKKEIAPDTMFDVGYFSFPIMECHPDYPDGAPDMDYTRSIGGPHGYYGVINKTTKQTELVMDFLMFWASKQGQDIEMQAMDELGIAIKGKPYIKDVEIPESINLSSGMFLKGIADDNPAVLFARGLGDEPLSTRDFQSLTERLFVIQNLSIDRYATDMQNSLINNMSKYLKIRGYRSNCLDNDNVTISPF